MTVIKRTGYVSTSKCDAMVAALPTLPIAEGKEYRSADDKSKISVYQLLRYYSFPESLKTAWKTNIPSEVSSSYLVSTFLKIPRLLKLFTDLLNKILLYHQLPPTSQV